MLAIAVSQVMEVPVSAADLASLPSTKVFSLSQLSTISLDPFYLQVAEPSAAQSKRNSIDGHYGEGGFWGNDVQTPDVKRDDDASFDKGLDIKIVPRADEQA